MTHSSDTLDRLVSELLADRRAQRRRSYLRMALVAVLGLAGLALAFFLAWQASRTAHPAAGEHVAVVTLRGIIAADEQAGAANLADALERAFADEAAKGVVLLIDSPGGAPVQASLIHDHIVRLKKEHPGRKVVAVGEDLVASGAYMVAVAADEIVVNPSTLVGSVGVVSRGFGFTGLLEKLGVERRVATAGANKNLLDPFAPVTDAARAKQAEILADVHEHFIALVRAGRGERLAKDRPELFSGDVWTGRRALELGLVDRIGDLQQVVHDEFGAKSVREYAPRAPLLRELMRRFSVQVNVALSDASPGASVRLP